MTTHEALSELIRRGTHIASRARCLVRRREAYMHDANRHENDKPTDPLDAVLAEKIKEYCARIAALEAERRPQAPVVSLGQGDYRRDWHG